MAVQCSMTPHVISAGMKKVYSVLHHNNNAAERAVYVYQNAIAISTLQTPPVGLAALPPPVSRVRHATAIYSAQRTPISRHFEPTTSLFLFPVTQAQRILVNPHTRSNNCADIGSAQISLLWIPFPLPASYCLRHCRAQLLLFFFSNSISAYCIAHAWRGRRAT